MECVKGNTETLAEMVGVTIEKVKRNRKRYEQYIREAGWVVEKQGRGDNTVYYIYQYTPKEKEWQELKLADKIEMIFGFKPAHPQVMIKYIMWITKQNGITYANDKETALLLGFSESSRWRVNICRKELVDNGYMVSLPEQTKAKYYIINKFRKKEITAKEWAGYWKTYFDNLKAEKTRLKEMGCTILNESKFKQGKYMELAQVIGGVLNTTKAREVTEDFNIKIKEYFKMEEM